jgi:hypothetical protein
VTAASFQDWKRLASRDSGEDGFIEGDLSRAAGNITGSAVGYAFRRSGKELGSGVTTLTSSIGSGIESASSAIGVGALGAGVNSLVSGIGSGVGDTISGVGSGAGRVFQGAGQGLGHVVGGGMCLSFYFYVLCIRLLTEVFSNFDVNPCSQVTGGALLVGKGAMEGITKGDGRAAASGLAQGAASIGAGVGQGVESVVTGAAEGVLQVGQGLFSGVRNVGRGIGGAFSGKRSAPPHKNRPPHR